MPRLPVVLVVCAYSLLSGAALFALLAWFRGQEPGVGTAIACGLPLVVSLLVIAREKSLQQLLAKSCACLGFLPVLLWFWGAEQVDAEARAAALERVALWPFMVAAAVVHVVAFVLFVFWAGTRSTRVRAVEGAERVAPSVLRERLRALERSGAPLTVRDGDEPGELIVRYRFAESEARSHLLRLHVDAQRRRVRVRERSGASGAAPASAAERDMRPLGSVGIDPTRPDAQQVSSRVAMTSILEPQDLEAVPLALHAEAVELEPAFARALDANRMALLVCAVVTRSGFDWHPVFFGGDAR